MKKDLCRFGMELDGVGGWYCGTVVVRRGVWRGEEEVYCFDGVYIVRERGERYIRPY